MTAEMTAEAADLLRQEFSAGQVGKRPQGGTMLSYVGHAAVTDRLLKVDPEWSWEPMGVEASGLPAYERDDQGHPIGLWIRLTVCGVTRLGYGDAGGKQGGNAVKEMIGDALRNAAMRFGVALDLWHKGDLADTSERGEENRTSRTRTEPTAPSDEPAVARSELAALCKERGWSTGDVALTFTGWDTEHRQLPLADAATVREFTGKLRHGDIAPEAAA